MRLLIWLWERTGTELFVTGGKWDWDEWHAFHYGRYEALSNLYCDPHPGYCNTEPHYHLKGRAWGRRQRIAEDVVIFVTGALLFIGGLYLVSVLTILIVKGLA